RRPRPIPGDSSAAGAERNQREGGGPGQGPDRISRRRLHDPKEVRIGAFTKGTGVAHAGRRLQRSKLRMELRGETDELKCGKYFNRYTVLSDLSLCGLFF